MNYCSLAEWDFLHSHSACLKPRYVNMGARESFVLPENNAGESAVDYLLYSREGGGGRNGEQ